MATTHDQTNFKDWINTNWKAIRNCLKLILPIDLDESITQFILKTFQNMINLCGRLGMNQARDVFLETLCQGCLPNGKTLKNNLTCKEENTNKDFNLRNIQTTKTLFNIAHCLGGKNN